MMVLHRACKIKPNTVRESEISQDWFHSMAQLIIPVCTDAHDGVVKHKFFPIPGKIPLNLKEIQVRCAIKQILQIPKLHSKKALNPTLNLSKLINLKNFTRMKVCT